MNGPLPILKFILLSLMVVGPVLAQPRGGGGPVNLRDLNIPIPTDIVAELYQKECAVCHGETLRGGAQGTPLVGIDLQHGNAVGDIAKSTADGSVERGMPAWSSVFDEDQIWALSLYIAEQRQGTNLDDFRYNAPLVVPKGVVKSEHHNFRVETVIDGLDALPFGIAPLPDGRILLSEKRRGLSIISREGTQSDIISGAPKAYDDSFNFVGQPMGLGWMMDVALHPDYVENGWVYVHYGDRCSDCNEMSNRSGQPVSMNKLVRGRIKDGAWVDEEVIWESSKETYTLMPEIAAGGRIAFDDQGYVYFSVGMKGPLEHIGIQDLTLPYGKIMRLHNDGRVPEDNPFLDDPTAVPAMWSYGHRNPQGLEFNVERAELWSSEMGPRGGDEINLIQPGLNYGWPLISKGVNYDGTPITFGEVLGIGFDPADMVQPVVDLTPAPAVSSFIFYEGAQFPKWHDNVIVGTLRATDLFRIVLNGDKVVHTELLLEDVARFRDIEIGPDGSLYILLEHDSGGQIMRLVSTVAEAAVN
ncbi:MAG: glucose sorbosone dehydrogenase [Rhodospirillaceae bacterium]|jgi:aldose sugar dehydrogenase|nr:glucose sorbosone dehydrogenase [Rhodospirillaceae bacterium]MBT5241401.1 glucose sorbosone dehydrogenase [Rhodospirillaceae bacterium]MBT5566593.1 glucose sorbosone dehydrogenase [Rhodospirillaceae bacterium]MBT6090682.1 glucose sorbosone dehydrogenase [Rhodospirillaceae bacterium]MBT7449429.1 glucose sorbosone dehydrogenase [Rhodospirillaceae bacterium]